MMIADRILPAWMDRSFEGDLDDTIPAWTAVHTDESRENWFFTGVVGEMIRMFKLPLSMEIALDMDLMIAIIRVEFEEGGDGRNDAGGLRAIYTFMSVESFALLWNLRPESIHGFPAEAITLHLNANDEKWPAWTAHLRTLISFDGERFVVEPDLEHLPESIAA